MNFLRDSRRRRAAKLYVDVLIEQASVDAINSSEKVAIAAEQSAKHALDSTRAILASLGGDISETEKKADSLE